MSAQPKGDEMTQLSITESFRNLETKIHEPTSPERLPREIEPQLDRLRRELLGELRSALQTLPEIQRELRHTGQATLELASPLRDLLNELEQLMPSLRAERPRRWGWGWIAGAIVAVMVSVMAAQPEVRVAAGIWLLPKAQRSALEMGEALITLYPRLSEEQRRSLEQMLSPARPSGSSGEPSPPPQPNRNGFASPSAGISGKPPSTPLNPSTIARNAPSSFFRQSRQRTCAAARNNPSGTPSTSDFSNPSHQFP